MDCILERSNQILLAKVEIINKKVYAIPIDDRILAKIKLPKEDQKYIYDLVKKNIVKVEIDLFPIGQQEGFGHVINELKLNDDEILDIEFVLSKSNISQIDKKFDYESKEIKEKKRIDLSKNNSYMFKSWNGDSSPLMPLIQIEQEKNKSFKLWLHTNAISERLDLSNKKSIEKFFNKFESFPLLNNWQNYLSKNICDASEFKLGKENQAVSLCLYLNSDYEIVNWSFHLTIVKCSSIIENKQLEALLTRKKLHYILSSKTYKKIC